MLFPQRIRTMVKHSKITLDLSGVLKWAWICIIYHRYSSFFEVKSMSTSGSGKQFLNFNLARSTPLFLRGDLGCQQVVLFILRIEFIIRQLIRTARSSFRGGTLGTPFLLRISCLFCCYVTVFEDYFLLRYLFN